MNTQEQKRLLVLNRLLCADLTMQEAATLLALSTRQVRRMLAAYRKEGAAALVHGNRGRQPAHTISPEVRQRVVELARTTYAGCNQQHLRDLLEEREGIVLSRASVHRILEQIGLLAARRQRPAQHRRRRERMVQEGMLVQIDGSRHQWLGPTGSWLTLLAAIDDATGQIVAALFREQEDAQGYFLLVQQLVQRCGRPLALYHDRHSIFLVTSPKEAPLSLAEQLAGKAEPTQFGRLLGELGITSIAAQSPQAKGRVERLFGTLQDRLVIELRLAGAECLTQAQAVLEQYLPRFNRQFAVPAAQPATAWQPLPAALNAKEVFCFKYRRMVASDNTVSFAGQRLQVEPGPQRKSYARASVEVHERLDGSLAVYHAGICLTTMPAPLEAPKLRARPQPLRQQTPPAQKAVAVLGTTSPLATPPGPKLPAQPRPDHPWKQAILAKQRTKSVNT
ncbi:MAG TPA: ISNCY family transposase [Ktedonobacterales bacterium]|nr:ISNCY family transposase [Ktedonobacterales bacterium]